MKHRALIGLTLCAWFLVSCGSQPHVDGEIPPTAPPPLHTATAVPSETPASPVLSFTPATYRDQANGFELDYPSDWSISPATQIGSRGSQAQLFSPGATAEQLPDGASRIGVTVYLWDPKNDLAAYVDHRKVAWESGTQSIESGQEGDLPGGRHEFDFIVRGADGARAFFLFTSVGDRYLEISGEGDLALIREVAHTVRPLDETP